MSKGGGSAPAPDPQIGRAALMQARTGEEWLSFAKDAFAVSNERQAELDALTKQVSDLQIGMASDQLEYSRKDRQRYEQKFRPIEDEFVEEAANYGSPERQAEAAAEAKADVQTAASQARAQAQREASSMGLNPNSGRFASIDRATEMGTALASAGAQNAARQQTRDKGLALKADVVNLGRGLPTMSAQAASLGLSAGSNAVGLHQNSNAQYLASTDIMGSGFKGQMSGYAGQANTLNQQYGLQLDAWKAEQQMAAQSMAGIGSAIGGIAGMFFSDENLKTDKTELAEGTALEAVMEMPVESWDYKEGVADEGRHIGPYAQDFTAATGLGDGQMIAAQDAIGVTMAAVQDLNAKVDRIAGAIGLGDQPVKSEKKKRGKAIGLGGER